ncbi:hypothetical protein GCK72_016338 [Caenorhabditis remanei]|uniref:SET domain-containing protein n=1 Tax=Caenorhabditis remanei TaxID=31234 RepID=A0A6A5GYS7_CAERE|nr:hypothetical protein GCK72_016338 [Caenorhabditis remanei]KAF1759871.1 hypothetical protein GCK72_016338 [Caenorhabditis remanei]
MTYTHIPTTIPGPGITEDEWNDEFKGCDCLIECTAESGCTCLTTGIDNYSEDRRLLPTPSETPQLLIECSTNCACCLMEPSCRNRVVQNGIMKELEVFSTSDKGDGARTLQPIQPGEFVCEYASECIGEEEVQKRHVEFRDDNYTLTLKEHFGQKTIKTFLDPRLRGNIGRFLNHSCQPNCDVVVVRLGRMCPTAGIFAKREIQPGEELCYDYGRSELEGNDRKPCRCGTTSCRGFLPMSATPNE